MSRRGNCWDNAVAESVFSSLKKERVKKTIYRTREVAHAEISDYIDSFCNPSSRHGHPGGVSPEESEKTGHRGVHEVLGTPYERDGPTSWTTGC